MDIVKYLKEKKVPFNVHEHSTAYTAQELATIFSDVEVGAEPPFGNLYGLDTIVDQHLAADERIVFNAGTHRQAVEMAYADFARLAGPKVMDFSVHL